MSCNPCKNVMQPCKPYKNAIQLAMQTFKNYLKGDLEKIGYTSSNGPPRNYCKVLNKYLTGHVLGGQNGGSTNMPLFGRDHECKECKLKYE